MWTCHNYDGPMFRSAVPRGQFVVSAGTVRRIERSSGELATQAASSMEVHEWYRRLPAADRAWVGLVAQAAIAQFIAWFKGRGTTDPAAASVFGTAPRELTRSITLQQTLDLIRSVVDVVETGTTELAAESDAASVREAVLRYSREIAFAAAEVYALAAEARGAWDARLEDLVVDALSRGEREDSLESRAAALGWTDVSAVTVVAGEAQTPTMEALVDDLRRVLARSGLRVLVGVQRHRLVLVVGSSGETRPAEVTKAIADAAGFFGDGPIVIGPTVAHVVDATESARSALLGLAAAPAWPDAPRPVHSEELLPERALNDDPIARRLLVERIVRTLQTPARADLLTTAAAFLDCGRSLEQTARLLFVHPNTVRYRLGRIADLTGYDLHDPRDSLAVTLALAYDRLSETAQTTL